MVISYLELDVYPKVGWEEVAENEEDCLLLVCEMKSYASQFPCSSLLWMILIFPSTYTFYQPRGNKLFPFYIARRKCR